MRTPAVAEADVPEWVPPVPRQGSGGEPAGPAPVFGALQWQFPALPVHARMSRVWLEAWMSDIGLGPETAYRAAVAFSEVVTNAVLHGSGLITVQARIALGVLECEVGDAAADLPVVYEAGADDEHHRGLSLVDALTDDWRVSARPGGGKTVAFTIRPDEAEADAALAAAASVVVTATATTTASTTVGSTATTVAAEPRIAPPAPRTDPDVSGFSTA